MKINPAYDGVKHINVYSQGKTELGKALSNFAHLPFTGGVHTFGSVEAWWYWYKTGKIHDNLISLYGFKAKQEGRKYDHVNDITPAMLEKVYKAKLDAWPGLHKALKDNHLPLFHYYVYGGKAVVPYKFVWTAELWNNFK